ncbi:hypothetical protein G7Y89_g12493 [Cudoniella acicularis]|uniref:NADH:flavin oxidoreductase/NADH oxidase N-terminal domain-containing protein n=1 Tax=Cudoniella acicularis TaxID=354080 RepID=A0A8H4RCH2_9HELO|nr:hypothetical protein G7Y89_g12493 [Cudoniella acicularis]
MLLSDDITLPCGLRFPNRLAKAAMAESMAPDSHNPDDKFLIAYREWAEGGWGNVMVSQIYLGGPADVQIPTKPSERLQEIWKAWAETCQRQGTPTLVQLCHPGRQSPPGAGQRSFFSKTIAPSAVKLDFGHGLLTRAMALVLFGTPREMTLSDINEAIEQFVAGAKQSHVAGFKGVELHGAHGYLLAQFLSPKSNIRQDEFGGSPAKRAEIVLRIIRRIREETSKEFCIGIKLNSVDASDSGSLEDIMEQIGLIDDAGIDFVEISGGTYEKPLTFQDSEVGAPNPGSKTSSSSPNAVVKTSTLQREAFFLSFAQTVRQRFPSLILMVTGGFRTRLGMEAALQSGACDLIGIARPAAVIPQLPKEIILNTQVKDEDANIHLKPFAVSKFVRLLIWLSPIRSVGAGVVSVYYASQIQRMGQGLKPVDSRV